MKIYNIINRILKRDEYIIPLIKLIPKISISSKIIQSFKDEGFLLKFNINEVDNTYIKGLLLKTKYGALILLPKVKTDKEIKNFLEHYR